MQDEDRSRGRRMKGFEPAGGLLRNQIRKVSEEHGFAATRLLTHWDDIAGPELATLTRPVKIGFGQGGFGATLTLLVKGAAGPMVELQLPALRDRVNACYGYNAIARIRLTQTASEGFAATGPVADAVAPPAEHPLARQAAEKVQDAQLREALEALGNRVLTRRQQQGP